MGLNEGEKEEKISESKSVEDKTDEFDPDEEEKKIKTLDADDIAILNTYVS